MEIIIIVMAIVFVAYCVVNFLVIEVHGNKCSKQMRKRLDTIVRPEERGFRQFSDSGNRDAELAWWAANEQVALGNFGPRQSPTIVCVPAETILNDDVGVAVVEAVRNSGKNNIYIELTGNGADELRDLLWSGTELSKSNIYEALYKHSDLNST